MKDLFVTRLGRFRLLAFGEGASLLLLLIVTMPLKYLLGIPGPNQVVGLIHGLLFVWYVFAVIQIKIEKDWSVWVMFLALVASIVPFGTFYFTARLLPRDE